METSLSSLIFPFKSFSSSCTLARSTEHNSISWASNQVRNDSGSITSFSGGSFVKSRLWSKGVRDTNPIHKLCTSSKKLPKSCSIISRFTEDIVKDSGSYRNHPTADMVDTIQSIL